MHLQEKTLDRSPAPSSFSRIGNFDFDGWRHLIEGNREHGQPTLSGLDLLGHALSSLASDLKRIADKCDPPPPDLVDTEYVAEKLGVTLKRISQMALAGDIPPSCIVPGTGQGKPWKFYRSRIDPWIANR